MVREDARELGGLFQHSLENFEPRGASGEGGDRAGGDCIQQARELQPRQPAGAVAGRRAVCMLAAARRWRRWRQWRRPPRLQQEGGDAVAGELHAAVDSELLEQRAAFADGEQRGVGQAVDRRQVQRPQPRQRGDVAEPAVGQLDAAVHAELDESAGGGTADLRRTGDAASTQRAELTRERAARRGAQCSAD